MCLRFFLVTFLGGHGGFTVGPVYCSWDPQTSFFNKTSIKNGSHCIIYTFKNYFTIVFLVYSFQQNKRYLNGLLRNNVLVWSSVWAKTVCVISLDLWKRKKKILAYVGSGQGREAIQKMAMRER